MRSDCWRDLASDKVNRRHGSPTSGDSAARRLSATAAACLSNPSRWRDADVSVAPQDRQHGRGIGFVVLGALVELAPGTREEPDALGADARHGKAAVTAAKPRLLHQRRTRRPTPACSGVSGLPAMAVVSLGSGRNSEAASQLIRARDLHALTKLLVKSPFWSGLISDCIRAQGRRRRGPLHRSRMNVARQFLKGRRRPPGGENGPQTQCSVVNASGSRHRRIPTTMSRVRPVRASES